MPVGVHVRPVGQKCVEGPAANDHEGVLRTMGGQSLLGGGQWRRDEDKKDNPGPERRGLPERVSVRGAVAGDGGGVGGVEEGQSEHERGRGGLARETSARERAPPIWIHEMKQDSVLNTSNRQS